MVIPCHNEEMNIGPLVTRLRDLYGEYLHEIIPGRRQQPGRHRAGHRAAGRRGPRIKPVIRTPPNGVGRAIADGYRAATGRYVLSMDCDFQHLLPDYARPVRRRGCRATTSSWAAAFRGTACCSITRSRRSSPTAASTLLAQPRAAARFRDLTNNLKLMRREVVERAAAVRSRASRSMPRRGCSRCSWATDRQGGRRSPGSTARRTWGRRRSGSSGSAAATGGCSGTCGGRSYSIVGRTVSWRSQQEPPDVAGAQRCRRFQAAGGRKPSGDMRQVLDPRPVRVVRWRWRCRRRVALAIAVRVPLFTSQGLWADEVFSLAMATGHSLEHPAASADPTRGDFVEPSESMPPSHFRQYVEHESPAVGPVRVVRAVRLSDTSPPLYYVALWAWTLATGTGDAALRSFSTLLSVASLPLMYLAGRRMSGRGAGLAAAFLLAVSPMSAFYGTEGACTPCCCSSCWRRLFTCVRRGSGRISLRKTSAKAAKFAGGDTGAVGANRRGRLHDALLSCSPGFPWRRGWW